MKMTTIRQLFTLFSGEEDIETFQPILDAAVEEVVEAMKEGTTGMEVRLCYLTAAIANLHYTQIHGAREKALSTYAGTLRRVSDSSQQVRFAKQLVYSYRKLCADLLTDSDFAFFGCKG